MTTFVRVLSDKDKGSSLLASCTALRAGSIDARIFDVAPSSFRAIPGAPFAYWVSDAVRLIFKQLPAFEGNGRSAQHGASTKDDFRFLRVWWENPASPSQWTMFAKGGAFSPFYADVYLTVNWKDDARELEAALLHKYPYLGKTANWVLHRECSFFRPGLTWPSRTQSGLSMRAMPHGCIFGHKGPAAFVTDDAPETLLALLALVNSKAFGLLVSLQMSFGSYEVGVIQKTPVPEFNADQQTRLAALARRAWSLKRSLDAIDETSHAFALPAALRSKAGKFDPPSIEAELTRIQADIDAIALDLFGLSEKDCAVGQAKQDLTKEDESENTAEDEDDDEEIATPIDQTEGLLSWAVGVAFGRFDWRLATGERAEPAEPEPFDPLPSKSPGMLPDDATPFHVQDGILVDDAGHPHDLPHLINETLARVHAPEQGDVRSWLQRDFFPFHLKRYSKSRRKAPIYWPLSTASGSYTLWIYYPSLTPETLYRAINDFLDPKLKQVNADALSLSAKGAKRSSEEEKRFAALQTLESELKVLRNALNKIAPDYKPRLDDGVQITAAPLWSLFGHAPWKKILKDTWTKLERGDFDWSHLSMNYWSDRVREKCKTDKSLAIAHGLEHLYVEPQAAAKKTRGRRANGA